MLPPTIMQMTEAERRAGAYTGVFVRRVGRDVEYIALIEGKRVGRPEKKYSKAQRHLQAAGGEFFGGR